MAVFPSAESVPLPTDYWITAEDLQNTAKAQNVEIQKGDILLIRTGWRNPWVSPRVHGPRRTLGRCGVEALGAGEIVGQREGAPSTPLVCPVTRGNVDLVHLLTIPACIAEDRAMVVFKRDPGNGEPVLFGVTAE